MSPRPSINKVNDWYLLTLQLATALTDQHKKTPPWRCFLVFIKTLVCIYRDAEISHQKCLAAVTPQVLGA